MDSADRKLLNLLQTDFPLVARPYAEVALQLGTSENDAIARVKRLASSGIIRKIGPILDSRALGYASTLAAMAVPENQIDRVAEIVNSFPGVTHNYIREAQEEQGGLSPLRSADVAKRRPARRWGLSPSAPEMDSSPLPIDCHPPNMWFTVHARNQKGLRNIIAEIERRTGLKVVRFDATKIFKISVQFQIEDPDED